MKLNPIKPKTLGSILGSFNKTLADLDSLVARNRDQISKNAAAVATLQQQAETLTAENEQADRVAARIKEFVA